MKNSIHPTPTVLLSAYAINPYKGSEDGTGWNLVMSIAENHKVIAITRENNQADIERFQNETPPDQQPCGLKNVQFLYYDLPLWMRFWKRKSRGAMLYFYLWQLFLPLFVKRQKASFDLVHNLNFHNDWTFSMLWVLGKPMVWGPVGHHPSIPAEYLEKHYGKSALWRNRGLWLLKKLFWTLDPLLRMTVKRSNQIIAINSSVPGVLHASESKFTFFPAVGSEPVRNGEKAPKDSFTVLSVGRFVPLKGFDICIQSFAAFYRKLNGEERKRARLILIGKGPEKATMEALIKENHIESVTEIIEWLPRHELKTHFQNASVFLFPSHEGAGMVIPEALSYGLPILCFDNIGPGELMDESCGLRTPYTTYDESVDHFSENLLSLFHAEEYRQRLSANAKTYFDEKLCWATKADLFNLAYSRAIKHYEYQRQGNHQKELQS